MHDSCPASFSLAPLKYFGSQRHHGQTISFPTTRKSLFCCGYPSLQFKTATTSPMCVNSKSLRVRRVSLVCVLTLHTLPCTHIQLAQIPRVHMHLLCSLTPTKPFNSFVIRRLCQLQCRVDCSITRNIQYH